ncbi:MAG: response regulator [Pseudomonadota bacterium]
MKLTLDVRTISGAKPDLPIVGVFDTRGGAIGRARSNDLVLPDRFVSGRHAHVVLREDRFFVIDTSQNGTFLNGAAEPIGWCKTAEIVDGDELSIGHCVLTVTVGPSVYDAPTMEISRDVLDELYAPGIHDAPPVDEETETIEGRTSAILVEPHAATRARSGSELFETPTTEVPPDAPPEQFSSDVLIVDDDEEVSYFVKFMLERAGYEVAALADGLAALEYIDEHAPVRLVVMDPQLPYLDGYQVLNTLRAHKLWRGVPIIILSAMSGEQEVVRALNSGALDYIVKPFKPTELVARLQRFLPRDE